MAWGKTVVSRLLMHWYGDTTVLHETINVDASIVKKSPAMSSLPYEFILVLTHRGRMMHISCICISKLGHHWFE